jgi:hypothetical protein
MQNRWYMRVLQYWPHWWYKVYFNKVLKCNYNTLILKIISLPFTINVTNLTISSFVPWFRILSQYGVGIVFLLDFSRIMQHPSKFHGECKYPKIMHVLELNSMILFKRPFTINVKNFAIPSFTWINICLTWYSERGINIRKKHYFLSLFMILLQNDVGITFLISFVRSMQYPSKFQKICYGAQRFYGIP